jgi:CRP-like cAMP-binding protein
VILDGLVAVEVPLVIPEENEFFSTTVVLTETRTLTKGDSFGELALITEFPRAASIL